MVYTQNFELGVLVLYRIEIIIKNITSKQRFKRWLLLRFILSRSESKARVVKILTTQNSSETISLAYLDDSADLNKSIKMVLTTHWPKQI